MYINVQKLFVVVHVDGYKDLSKSGSTQQVDSMIHESRRYAFALQIIACSVLSWYANQQLQVLLTFRAYGMSA
jgi:hypothetical protein